MPSHPYHLVDVFTDRAFGGNPLAVFPDARGIPGTLYQSIARELNLSETTFVLPPDDPAHDCRVRIFTPWRELPMAGHPTVGTAYVLTRLGLFAPHGDPAGLVFEEGVGPIPVEVPMEGGVPGRITMDQPRPVFGEVFPDRAAVASVLSLPESELVADLPVQSVSCGVPYLIVPLRSLDAVRRLRFRADLAERHLKGRTAEAVYAFTTEAETPGGTVHGRMFAPGLGVFEDPATGSAAGPLGCYLVRHGVVPTEGQAAIVSEQGFEMGRASFLHIAVGWEGDEIVRVRVGGTCVSVGAGALEL